MDEIREEVVPKAGHDELAAFLSAHKPPEEAVLEVRFGAGDDARVTEFHFRRSLAAFGRYTQTAYGDGGDVVAASLRFLVDSAREDERLLVEAFATAYPVDAVNAARQLMSIYAYEGIETRIKNG